MGLYYITKTAILKVISMQRPGTGTIKTQIQPLNHDGKQLRLQISRIQREHMANRVSSLFPKGGY